MGLPWNVNASMGGAGVNYQIQRSLRFRSSASAYLSRTPASNGNQTKWTVSFWYKPGRFGSQQPIITSYTSVNNYALIGFSLNAFINASDTFKFYVASSGTTQVALETTSVYRDPSAWYHVVVAVDTTQATSTNRVLIYVNGVQVTSFSTATYPSLNASLVLLNTTNPQQIGALATGTYGYYDGYMAEFNWIDGQQLTPASFGYNDPVTGVWQPAPFKGTYGTNGFYLPFTDIATTSGSNFGLGRDYSGNSNYFNTNNISVTAGATYDSMIDSPTNFGDGTGIYNRGNYSTFNPLVRFQPNNSSYSSGNLGMQQTGGASGSHACAISSLSMSSGKWYAEFTDDTATYDGNRFGILNIYNNSNYTNSNPYIGWAVDGYCIYKTSTNAVKENNGVTTTIGSNWSAGAVISIAVDIDNSKIWWRVNGGAWFGGGDPAAGTSPVFTIISGNTYAFATAPYNNNGVTSNFGQRPFAYTPPTGFKALNTFNLPTPTIPNGGQNFNINLYTGDGTNPRTVSGLAFSPDFVWVKNRSAGSTDNVVSDKLITDYSLFTSSNIAAAQGYIKALGTNSFDVGNPANVNGSGNSMVAWYWKGAGSGTTNTSGSITSTVDANQTAGFSVVTMTYSSVAGTVGHGLGVAPNMIIVKRRDSSGSWYVAHSGLTNMSGYYLLLESTAAQGAASWGGSPTSTVFYMSNSIFASGNYVAYCFSAVRGFSAFGSYTGNGSTDGPFVYTGFSPRFVLIKKSSGINSWVIYDTSRQTYNANSARLFPNLSNAEQTGSSPIDILSSGFKCRDTDDQQNASGGTYIYAAFAENPFNYSRAR